MLLRPFAPIRPDSRRCTRLFDKLVPVCADLLDAAAREHEVIEDVRALELMRAIGNLCAGGGDDTDYDARRMVGVLLAGLRRTDAA